MSEFLKVKLDCFEIQEIFEAGHLSDAKLRPIMINFGNRLRSDTRTAVWCYASAEICQVII